MGKERSSEKRQKLFPSDEIATEIASCIKRDLSQVPLFDRTWGSDVSDRLRSRQVADTLKRYQRFSDYDRSALERKAFDEFRLVNRRIGSFNDAMRDPSFWEIPILSRGCKNYTLSWVRHASRLLLSQVLGPCLTDELHLMCKHGSGSTVGASFEDTSVDKKFTYPISCTQRVSKLFDVHTRYNPRLERSLMLHNRDLAYGERYDIIEASRGTTVDKTSDKRRMIAIEPTLNMYFQQGLMLMMYARLKSEGLDLASLPQRHRDLARKGSIDSSYGTIDFSSASDSVAYELIRNFFPPDWFAMLDLVRTPSMEIEGEILPLEMFSTMGNATTFPLETLVFWAVACSCHHLIRGELGGLISQKTRRACSVFGDDCIVPTESCELFIEVIKLFGFRVNEDKTFIDPGVPFRESCGGDYYRGIDVRPYAFKAPRNQKLSSLEPWLYTILNNILPIYTRYFGYYQSGLTMELMSLVIRLFQEYKLKFKLVPLDYPDDSGLRCCFGSHELRPRLDHTFDLLSLLGAPMSPIYRSDRYSYRFAYVKFNYPKDRRRNDDLRYALELSSLAQRRSERGDRVSRDRSRRREHLIRWLLSLSFSSCDEETGTFPFARSPIRRRGGYVVSRTVGKFY